MKRLVALGVAVSSMFLLQGTALAAHGDIQSLNVDETAVLLDDGRVRVSGTITCTVGARWRVGARLNQDGSITGRGGPDTGDCSGTAQRWVVFISPNAGDEFSAGAGSVTASAQTGVDPNVIERSETTESVTVVEGNGGGGSA